MTIAPRQQIIPGFTDRIQCSTWRLRSVCCRFFTHFLTQLHEIDRGVHVSAALYENNHTHSHRRTSHQSPLRPPEPVLPLSRPGLVHRWAHSGTNVTVTSGQMALSPQPRVISAPSLGLCCLYSVYAREINVSEQGQTPPGLRTEASVLQSSQILAQCVYRGWRVSAIWNSYVRYRPSWSL